MDQRREAGRQVHTLRTLRTLPRPVIVLLCGIAINRMGSFVAIFLVLYLTTLGFSPVGAGVVLTAFGAGSILGVYAGGHASDRFGPRRVIVMSMLFSGLAVGAIAFEKRHVPLLLVTFVAGIVTRSYRPAASAMLADLTPRHQLVIATAATRLGLNVGATAGPLIGAWLVHYSYSAVFLVDALTAAAFGLVAMFALPETRTDRPGAADDTPNRWDPPAGTPHPVGLRHDRHYLWVLAAMLATALAEVQWQAILPLQLESEGAPTALYAAIVALNGALVILLELPLTRFVQRLPIRTAIAVGDLLIGLGLAVFGLAGPASIFFVGAVIWTMGEIVSAPSINAYPSLAAPPALRGRYIGALNACQTTGYAVGPIVGATLFQYVGRAAWLMCAVLGLLAYAGMWVGVRNSAAEPTAPDRTATGGAAPGG